MSSAAVVIGTSRVKISSEIPEKQGINLANPGFEIQCVIHYTTTAPHNTKTPNKKSVTIVLLKDLGPVVQSTVSLTSSLRGQLVKCFMTL